MRMPCPHVAAAGLMMVIAWQAGPVYAQQLSLHLPLNATLVADVADNNPLQLCTTEEHVSLTLDELLIPERSRAAATIILQLGLKAHQLSGAVILSAAGWHLTGNANSVLALTTGAGVSILYDMGVVHSAVQTMSVAFDGSRCRLCINLACPQPRPVSVLAALPGQGSRRQQLSDGPYQQLLAVVQLPTPVCAMSPHSHPTGNRSTS